MKQEKYTILQSNALSRACYKCTPLERQLLFYATMHTKQQHNGFYCSFSLSDFVSMLDSSDNRRKAKQDTLTAIKRLCEKHNNIKILDTESDYIATVWLQKAEINIKNDNVYFYFSDEIGKRLFYLKKSFTTLDFHTIAMLKKYYSIRLYEIMLSYKGFKGKGTNNFNQWFFALTVDDIKALFELSTTIRTNNITDRIVKPAIDEITSIEPSLKIELLVLPLKTDRRKIGAYEFLCSEKSENYQIRQEHKNLTIEPEPQEKALEQEIEAMKSKYWNKYIETAFLNPKQDIEPQFLYDCRILDIMKKQGFSA